MTTMRTKMMMGLAFAFSMMTAVSAFAQGEQNDKARASFPMPAAEFQQRVQARQTKARERMEKRVSQLPADKANEVRARFAERVNKVNAEVAKAVADGTVTKEEAQAIRALSPHRGHGKGACNKGGNGEKGNKSSR